MKTKAVFLTVVLAAGGLLFAGINAYAGKWHDPEEKADYIVKKIQSELDLNDEQKVNLDNLKKEVMGIYNETKSKRDEMHARGEKLMEQAILDQGQALAMVEEHTRLVNQYAPGVVAALATFYDGLSAEQQQAAREKLKKCHSKSSHGGFFSHH